MECRLRELSDAEKLLGHPIDTRPGDMWFCAEYLTHFPERLSSYYARNNSGREPLMVVLPSGDWWMLDGMACSDGKTHGDGWKVAGTPPRITVKPSINLVGRWHGFLQDGVLRTC